MKKQGFSFVKWLTNRDIQKILAPMNLEIMEKDDGSKKLRILREKDENGTRFITVFCKNNNDEYINDLTQFPYLGGMFSNALMVGTVLGTMGENSNFSKYNNDMVLRIDEFYITEMFSLKPEEEQEEFDRKLTRN